MRTFGLALALALLAGSASAQTWVNGYTRSDGTYVPGHYRSSPNGTTTDNYSAPNNVNPFTGQQGSRPAPNLYNYQAPTPPPSPRLNGVTTCRDGTFSQSSGSGACSGHGGVLR